MISRSSQFRQNIAVITGTVGGIGFLPKAPGTFASLIATCILFFINSDFIVLSFMIVTAFLLGLATTQKIENVYGKDASCIVIDEFAGQWLAFLFLSDFSLAILFSGFIIFRFFDILKPLGIKRIQNLKAGWGVLLDDIVAGIYTGIILYLLTIWEILK